MAQSDFKKFERYFSRFPDTKAEGRNFFAQILDSSTYYYCFPPPSLIHSTILHFLKYQARGLLLVPVWLGSSFWTLITPDGVHLACWCASFLKFRPSGFEVGPAVLSVTFREGRFDMLGLEFDFLGVEDKHMGVARRSWRTCLSGGCNVCR